MRLGVMAAWRYGGLKEETSTFTSIVLHIQLDETLLGKRNKLVHCPSFGFSCGLTEQNTATPPSRPT
jgi:hypothetical protein